MTLLRLGDETAGLDALRRAWKRDPYDVRTFNLLNLFEKVIPARYTTISSAHLRFRIPPAARKAITEVVAPFLEERYRTTSRATASSRRGRSCSSSTATRASSRSAPSACRRSAWPASASAR